MSGQNNDTVNNSTDKKKEVDPEVVLLRSKKQKALSDLERFNFDKIQLLIYTFIGTSIGTGISLVYYLVNKDSGGIWEIDSVFNLIIVVGAIFGSVTYLVVTEILRLTGLRKLRWIEYKLNQLGAEELQKEITEDFFTKLVQINFKYIDKYYEQTQEQANKSFRLSVAAAVVGLLILAAGIIMLYIRPAEDTAAYITTVAGALGEFIAAVFFYLYNRTILKMSLYHQKLVITQNISLALKIVDGMTGDAKARALEKLVDRLTLDVNEHLSAAKD
jgi:hypothetical protein